jgi:[acyl-carrier-protein] S-malonyltransferase
VLALLFPGQGSQRPGMGLSWRDHRSWAVVERIAAATGRDLAVLLTEADAETLRATRNAQLAAFGLSMVILDAARSAGLGRPVAAAGHSLGEYSALVAAGVLSLEDGARLVAARGEAMQVAAEQLPGTMAAVLGLDPQAVVGACAEVKGAWVANDNAPGQVVVAGTAAGVAAAGEAARAAGAKRVVALAVGGAFHSPLMAPAQEPLDAALSGASFGPAAFPVVTNLDATAHTDGWQALLSGQLASPVRWRESLLALAALGVDHFVELGPGSELSGMVKRTVDGATRANAATPEDLPGALAACAETEP